ncbi:MAG TPA: c-type cytochrome, partial [Anaerolineales bacterium]|nr:c-type cytochrome [Anaerolineales bacterium]
AGRGHRGRRSIYGEDAMRTRLIISLVVMLASASLIGAGWSEQASRPAPMPTPHMPPTPSGKGQLVDGEGLYQLYCITCHGDRLLGLTPEWIAQWPATHQNCWVSKCHGPNHPPDGYQLPKNVPALAGPGALAKFQTAADLHAFMQARMPYQEPGRLTSEEYWAIETYVLRENGIVVPEVLDETTASEVVLHPETVSTPVIVDTGTPSAPVSGPQASGEMDPRIAAIAVALGAVVGVILFLRRRRPTPPEG